MQSDPGDMFRWPIITKEDEEAVLEVLRRGAMSGWDVTMKFEEEFAAWQGTKYALGFNNGTASIHAAMFACGVGVGDEIICPSITFWASAAQCYSLGATVVFADIDPETLCIDPNDIEHRITERTKAIVVVHYLGHPADMDPIMEIAERHGIKGNRRRVARAGRFVQGAQTGQHRPRRRHVAHVGQVLCRGRSRHAGDERPGDLRAGHRLWYL